MTELLYLKNEKNRSKKEANFPNPLNMRTKKSIEFPKAYYWTFFTL